VCARGRAASWILVAAVVLESARAAGDVSLETVTLRHGVQIPAGHRQLVLVITPRWTASDGTLRRLERRGAAWQVVGAPIAVRVGGSGLGRGRGLHDAMPGALRGGPVKREGDRRSPAGVFSLGTAFGAGAVRPYAPGTWPWRVVGRRDRFVDDPASPHYNTWQRLPRSGRVPWRSAEELASYRLAVVVQHNVSPIAPGAGSAVFLHSTTSLRRPSVGCTVMTERALLELLRWLDPAARPLLVQLPATR
jgi:hypothetical protein